jgi:hypothetical protein
VAAIEQQPNFVRAALCAIALLCASGCGEEQAYGLHVEALDATFGLAQARTGRDAAGAGAATSGLQPPEGSGSQTADPGDAQVDPDASGALLAAADAGPPPRNCRNVASFTQNALPAVLDRCVRCHDGTKSKATKATDFTTARDMSPAAQQSACREALKAAPDASEHSPLFAEVNPSDALTVHDFKYPSAATYMAYRSAVLIWLESETAN